MTVLPNPSVIDRSKTLIVGAESLSFTVATPVLSAILAKVGFDRTTSKVFANSSVVSLTVDTEIVPVVFPAGMVKVPAVAKYSVEGLAVPATVVKLTVTLDPAAVSRVTVNTATVPSVTVTSSIVILGTVSPSVIVATPWVSEIVALVALDRLTTKFLLNSGTRSFVIGTSKVVVVAPAKMVAVPELAV